MVVFRHYSAYIIGGKDSFEETDLGLRRHLSIKVMDVYEFRVSTKRQVLGLGL